MTAKMIFFTGGVVSSVGKGVSAASMAKLLKERGLEVNLQKLDPYLNVDPGTMSPYQHGEVFVLDDGSETDLDLGHYERLGGITLRKHSSVTTGQIYQEVLNKERKGDFLGGTIQVIPHITNEIKRRVHLAADASKADVGIVEIGGTVGDIESTPYMEAIRQLRFELGDRNTAVVHVTFLPYIGATRELKTKPTQHSIRDLRSLGINPDVLILRSDYPISQDIIHKISSLCDIPEQAIVPMETADTIYEVPTILHDAKIDDYLINHFSIPVTERKDLSKWNALVDQIKQPKPRVKIALVGKYVELHDAYLSVVESLNHAGLACGVDVDIKWVNSSDFDNGGIGKELRGVDGVVIPGGFGTRGTEGKIQAITYARTNNIPLLGLCLGMQLIVIEYARNVCDFAGANSTEFDVHTKYPVIDIMEEQKMISAMGGTMRLGAYDCQLITGTKASKLYKADIISERHRHRFEMNNAFQKVLEDSGLIVSGYNPNSHLAEIVEIKNSHPYLVGCQFHPEFKSRLELPHPLFVGLIKAVIRQKM